MIKLQTQITNISSKVDGSIKITSETRELNGKDAAQLFGYRNKEVWQLIDAGEESLAASAIPTEKPDPLLGKKTQAQRIRGVIFKIWDHKGRQGDFDDYYKAVTEKMIDQLKEQLP